jgi:hypothetical protein
MADLVSRRGRGTPNAAAVDDDIALLLERVCAKLPHDYTRRLVRDVVRLKMELGFDQDVREYLKRRSGEYAAVSARPIRRNDRE